MFKMIECPANCGIWSVIHYLNARNVKLADIHHQIYEMYGENAMSDGMVRKWVTKFNEDHGNVRDKLHCSQPHTAAQTQALITSFGWEQFDHPSTAQI
jgi:hypothetical protein